MPTLVMLLGRVEVCIRPLPIDERIDGQRFGCADVKRTLIGSGSMNGCSCWTDLNNLDDDRWYIGVAPNTDQPVDEASVMAWLKASGPKPLF